MAMTGGIGYEIDQLKSLGVPELMRRQSVDPQLKYALALQEATKMVEAAARERDMSQQMPMPTDVVGQMETSLAKRLAPGVQQQGQRSMQMQNRAAMGLPGQAAPNLARMAQGGIVGYAEGGMPKVGEKSKGPIPQLSPEENAQMLKYLEGLKKFDYYDKNPDKVSPEGRKALELDRQMFEEQFSNAFKQKVNDMMYGPARGMAMGGSVQRYAPGGQVQIGDVVGGEEIVAILGGVPMSQADYDRYLRNQELRRGITQNTDRTVRAAKGDEVIGENPDGSPIYQSQFDRSLQLLEESGKNRFDPENRTGGRPWYAEGSGADRMGKFIGGIGDFITAPFQEGATRGTAAGARDVLVGLAGMAGYGPAAEGREVPITSGQPTAQNTGITAGMYDVRNMVAPTAQQKLGSMVDKPSAVLRDNRAEMAARAPQESGIRSLLSKAKPFADKASEIAQVLGRGAGASEGFEFAKIAEESRKIDAAEKAFEQEKELKKMDIAGRDAELARRLSEAAKIAGQELRLDAYNNAVATMRTDPTYLDAAKKLEEKYMLGTADWIPFNERLDEEGFNAALLKLEEDYLKNKVLAAERVAGLEQEGTAQTPATQRYQVVQ